MKKQTHKSKEQIIYEKEQKKLADNRMKFINEKFMPLFEGMTENIEEAQIIAESTKTAITQAFINLQKTMTVKELLLKESLQKVKKPELVSKHLKVLEALDDQTIDDSIRLLQGLFTASTDQLMTDIRKKKLSDFKKV